ncbi:MAG TPA: glycosyltransferase family 4 protein [Streptosporangiaceae bacterium]|jgi:glycosyltransferase involved in cell wall biosynthesis
MVQREAEALAGAGFDVDVICMRYPGRPARDVVNGVSIISLPLWWHRGGRLRYVADYGLFFVLAAGTLALRHIRRPYTVVQVNSMPDFLVFAAAVPKLLGSSVVAYLHEPMPELAETLYGPGRTSRSLARVEQAALRFADHSVTVTDQLKRRYVERGARADRISVVLNCPDPPTLLAGWTPPEQARGPGSAAGFVAVCHGTIEDRYGQDTIIEAAALLRDELPDLRIVLTGRGSMTDEMIRDIARRGLDTSVTFEGWVSRERLNDILACADVGIVAQKASPYSHLVHTNKMVDYWIFGLPVIASRLRAVSEAYGEQVIEYYEPGDAAALAAAIRRLHDDPGRRAELARNGRIAEADNGWGSQRAVYLGVFDALADRAAERVRPGRQSRRISSR